MPTRSTTLKKSLKARGLKMPHGYQVTPLKKRKKRLVKLARAKNRTTRGAKASSLSGRR